MFTAQDLAAARQAYTAFIAEQAVPCLELDFLSSDSPEQIAAHGLTIAKAAAFLSAGLTRLVGEFSVPEFIGSPAEERAADAAFRAVFVP